MSSIADIEGTDDGKRTKVSIPLEKWSRMQILAVGLCFIVNMIDGMDILLFSYIAPTLQQDWGLGADRLGVVFSVAIVGMAIGGLVLAPLADLYGRRRIILCALMTSTIAMLMSGFVTTLFHLIILRLMVGIGIGTVLASMAALVAEYAPPHRRNFAVGLLYAGYPLGAIFTGFVAAVAIPAFGWQACLIGAGCISALMLPPLFLWLPESMEFLVKRRPPDALIRLNSIRERMGNTSLNHLPQPEEAFTKAGVRGLFADGRTMSTMLLWLAMIFGFAALWFIISWIPKLATMSGLDQASAIYAGTTFNAGAFIGTVTLGFITAKLRLQPTILVFLVGAAVTMVVFGTFRFNAQMVLVIAFLIGFLLQGGFNGIYPLAAQLYPAEVRSTGIGWTMGIGRIGAILGPLIGGILIEMDLPLSLIFMVFAVPAVLGGICACLVNTDPKRTGLNDV